MYIKEVKNSVAGITRPQSIRENSFKIDLYPQGIFQRINT